MRTINYSESGLPQQGWYNVENGVQKCYNDRGKVQKKSYPEGQVVREYTAYSNSCPNTLTVVQPKNGVKGEFEIVEDVASKGFGQGKERRVLLKGIMNEHGDVIQISKNEKFLEGMVEHGKSYPNSARRVAKKCLKFFEHRI